MKRIPGIIVLLILLVTNTVVSQNISALKSWIVIANNTKAYTDIECKQFSSYKFQYKEELKGKWILIDTKSIRHSVVEIYHNKDTLYLPFPMLIEKVDLIDFKFLPLGKEEVDIRKPIPFDYTPDDLVLMDQKWNYHTKDYPKYLRKDVAEALLKMLNYAAEQGVNFRIVSAYRSIKKQRSLYIRAIQKKGIYQVGTAKPAHSEHHLGTTVDLTSTNRKDVLSVSFDKTKEGRWLQHHAHKFGFRQSYTKENIKESGYMAEPWHFRYIGF